MRGRANYFGGDGQLRIWRVGTHHEFTPDAESWDRVMGWLESGAKQLGLGSEFAPASRVYLYGNFVVCPVEPFREGAVQRAEIKSVSDRRYARSP